MLGVFLFLTRYGEQFARSCIISWSLLSVTLIGIARMTLRIGAELRSSRDWAVRRCAIAGLNPLGKQLAENARNNPACGLRIVGFYDDRATQRTFDELSVPEIHLGRLEELVSRAQAGEFDTVFITLPMRAEARIRQLLEQLGDTTASVYIVPDFFVFELLHSRWTQVGGLPTVSVFETPLYGVDSWVKRGFDLVVATCGLVVISPVMLICALLVKLSSKGPVFFRQKRYGLDGKEILVWKFRSMRTCDNGPVVQQAMRQDPRVTRIGALLRRTSLDELPQLFNVIEGSMSLVGPRPHATAHNERYRKLIRGYMLRHKVKPGITGLAQVEGHRGETETLDKMQKRVDCDHRYIREWSVWLDLKIILRTFFVVFKQENAY
ncbi:MAG: undecaprenyl-phosphate glucose phosphotransferase [Pirellulaceae bacterium]|nr:undecaprenyl-phosphate glucose phosphotransferase [Pirellulaceae bacterium]